jgi:acetyl esterase/lipase
MNYLRLIWIAGLSVCAAAVGDVRGAVAAVGAASETANPGGIPDGPKNPGQAAYVAQLLNAPAGPVPGIPEPILLWPNGAPGAVPDATGVFTDEDKPALYPFPAPADRRTGAAFLILPGGGFTTRTMDTEGVQIARFLNRHGIAGFVLRYRIGPNYPDRAISTRDAHRAMQFLRAHAADYGFAPDRIGVIGFSAGAELEGDAFYNHLLLGDPAASEPLDRISAQANIGILIYGGRPLQHPADAPPTFLFNTIEDAGHLAVEAPILAALSQAGVSVEAHFYQVGPHGTSLSPGDPQLGQWPGLMIRWLEVQGFLK